jgi:hypothetical protein
MAGMAGFHPQGQGVDPALGHATQLKDEGNGLFQSGEQWGEACCAYTEALQSLAKTLDGLQRPQDESDDMFVRLPRPSEEAVRALQATLLTNRAACWLQMKVFRKCIRVGGG